jgi:CheY-like chemotaxis protein
MDKMRVLVVEDDDMSYLYLNQLFMLTRATLVRAKSGKEALEFFHENQVFDLVLMDIQLPDIPGTEVTAEIKKYRYNLPVIAQTAGKTLYEIEQALESGCSAVLGKPFTMEEFFQVVGPFVTKL